MSEERKTENIWNAKKILYSYIYNSDEDGCLPNVHSLKDSSYKIGLQRLYAVLMAYGREPELFYRSEEFPFEYRHKCCFLLSNTRSEEKMNEFRELVKHKLRKDFKYDYIAPFVDDPDFLNSGTDIVFRKLMEYRKKLYAVEIIWLGMMECSRSVGVIYQVTKDMTREYIYPMCQIIDRMLILLMGDDYDKTFNTDELIQYGYPNVTDEELEQMVREEWD